MTAPSFALNSSSPSVKSVATSAAVPRLQRIKINLAANLTLMSGWGGRGEEKRWVNIWLADFISSSPHHSGPESQTLCLIVPLFVSRPPLRRSRRGGELGPLGPRQRQREISGADGREGTGRERSNRLTRPDLTCTEVNRVDEFRPRTLSAISKAFVCLCVRLPACVRVCAWVLHLRPLSLLFALGLIVPQSQRLSH